MSLVSIIFPMFFTVTDRMHRFYGGLEVRTLYLAKLLGEAGYEVNVLAPRGSHLSYKNVKVLTGNYRPWDGKTLHPVDLEKDLVESNFDALNESDVVLEDNHFHYYHYLKSMNPDEFPHLVMSWDHHPDNLPSLPNFPCHIIAVSKWVMSALREKFKNLGHYFYYAYSGLVLENYPEVDINDKQDNLYVFLARFSMVKSPHVILELAKEYPNDEFVLMGDVLFTQENGYARVILEESDELGNVKIIFNASWEEKINYLKRASGLLHPGFWNGPLEWDILEGLLYGAKVLCYDRGAVREIYHNGKHGYIVPFATTEEENIENYVRAFRNFKNLKVNREECRNRVLEHFDFKKNSYPTYKKVLIDNRNLKEPNR